MKKISIKDLNEWIYQTVNYIKVCSCFSIKEKDSFHIVLTGGETSKLIYPKLAMIETDWHKWHFWISDERISSELIDSNKNMIQNHFLEFIPIKNHQVHFMSVELGLEKAVREYENSLKTIELFDLALLGIGEDGHIASLFPNFDFNNPNNLKDIIIVNHAPKYPKTRLSLSADRLCKSSNILYIARGENKKNILIEIQKNDKLPCNQVKGIKETLLYYCVN
jgi:6-phosphogluconolactonase